MKAHVFHAKKEARQCTLLLHRKDYEKRIREGMRPELMRLLAEMLIQALKGDPSEPKGTSWKR